MKTSHIIVVCVVFSVAMGAAFAVSAFIGCGGAAAPEQTFVETVRSERLPVPIFSGADTMPNTRFCPMPSAEAEADELHAIGKLAEPVMAKVYTVGGGLPPAERQLYLPAGVWVMQEPIINRGVQ